MTGHYNDGEFCDPIKVGHLDALIEALTVARDRGRELGILPVT